jgi:putative pyoverdin transport system ATP-binding/permease protein
MKIILFFLQHSRRAVLLSIMAGVFSGICNAALLAAINSALKAGHPTAVLMWSFAGLCVLLPFARFSSEVLLTKLGQDAMYQLRMKLCRQVLSTPLRNLEILGPARVLTILTDDIPTIITALNAIPVLCVNAALVLGCLIYMGTLSWPLFGIVIVFMVIGIISYQLPIIKVHKMFRAARKDAETLLGHLRALTQGIKELKIHQGRREAFVTDGLNLTAVSLKQNNISALRLYSGAASWGQILVFVVIGLCLFLLPTMGHISGPTLTGYTLALLYLMTPLQVIMNSLPQLGRASVALQTQNELGLTLASTKAEISSTGQPDSGWNTLELRTVTHSYTVESDSQTFVLGPIDLTFRPGELVFITGGNGSGKTTLIKLITGLYLPEQGHVYLDGRQINDETVEWYRQHFSVVFSDFFLFEQLLGLAGPEVEGQAQLYLEQLKLSHKVSVTDGKLSTTELSQGQRKRLGLLTAYLEDRPIYIFDEWAADQDPYFKNIFYMHLLPELKAKGKTILVISHDDRYYNVADRIIKLDEGQVVSDTGEKVAASFEKAAAHRNARV